VEGLGAKLAAHRLQGRPRIGHTHLDDRRKLKLVARPSLIGRQRPRCGRECDEYGGVAPSWLVVLHVIVTGLRVYGFARVRGLRQGGSSAAGIGSMCAGIGWPGGCGIRL